MPTKTRLLIWTADRHSGKTTTAMTLVRRLRERGFTVAGLLAPSLYRSGELLGFDGLDVRTGRRTRLAERKTSPNTPAGFEITVPGRRLGQQALDPANAGSADLIVVDEFGPLEMAGEGWRKNVDLLLDSAVGLIMLVVRTELADNVQKLYSHVPSRKITATDPDSTDKVLAILTK